MNEIEMHANSAKCVMVLEHTFFPKHMNHKRGVRKVIGSALTVPNDI